MEPPPADRKASKPRGVSIVARDFQTVALYKSDGSFAGIRRPGSNKPIEVTDTNVQQLQTQFFLVRQLQVICKRRLGMNLFKMLHRWMA